jgi:NADH:ubiquinone oxidoreductase subunit F (NADH-binding)
MTHSVLEAGFHGDVSVLDGPLLLRSLGETSDPGLAEHRRLWNEPARRTSAQLIELSWKIGLTGRGGAEFPFARKLQAAVESGRKRELVVNCSEGEPASAKDSALLLAAPHLVLDGAQLLAEALDISHVHLAVPGERPHVVASVQAAIRERRRGRKAVHFETHVTSGGFVGGQARAVLEMLAGRDNLPVTAKTPEAISGLRGRPTMLSNAETLAHLAAVSDLGPEAYARWGTAAEPGTRLLSISADGPGGLVIEAPYGVPLAELLSFCGYDPNRPLLLGGYHGTWLAPYQVTNCTLSSQDLARFGARLGAGVLLPMLPGDCPLTYTAQIVDYLAQQRAKRCGPCTNGLPALAHACKRLPGVRSRRESADLVQRIRELAGLVTGRGACAHPDGTARLVGSMLDTFAPEVENHVDGYCHYS